MTVMSQLKTVWAQGHGQIPNKLWQLKLYEYFGLL